MSASVEQQILVKIKALVEGLPQVQVLASSIQSLNKGGSGFRRIEQDANRASTSIAGLSFRVKDTEKSFLGMAVKGEGAASVLLSGAAAAGTFSAAIAALGVGAGALGFGAFVAEGIRFNAVIESAKIGIATIIANTYDVKNAQGQLLDPVQSFNAALGKSEELERALQKSAILTKFEFEDILGFFNSTVISSAGLKTNLEQLVAITQDFSLAAGAANIDVEKVRTGIQQIFTGNVTVRNPLARVLFPGESTKQINESLKKFREAGTLVDFIEGKLAVFRLSADQVGQSFDAVASNVKDAFKLFAAQATLPLFDRLKEILGFIITQIVDLSGTTVKLAPLFQNVADIIQIIVGYVGDELVFAVKAILNDVGGWAQYLGDNKDALNDILPAVESIAINLAGMVGDTASVAGDLYTASATTRTWSDDVKYVALFVALIRDLLNIIIGSVESLIGGIGTGLFGALNSVVAAGRSLNDILANTVDLFDHVWAQKIRDAKGVGNLPGTDFANGLLTSGQSRFDSGAALDNFGNTIDNLNAPRPTHALTTHREGDSFSSRKNADAGKAGRDKAAKDRLNSARKLYDEIEKLQLTNAKNEAETYALANAQILKGWTRRFDQGLVSAEEFYAKKKALELDDLAHEEESLKKQQQFATLALKRDLGAIEGKFQLSDNEFSTLTAKLATLNPDQLATANPKLIKQAIEYTKYLEQTAHITQDLVKIDDKRGNIIADTTEKIQDQTRAFKQHLLDVRGELATTLGQDGVGDANNLSKRISDELPRLLTEADKGVPGITAVATAIRDIGSIDISGVTDQFTAAGIDVNSLSDETRTLIKLFTSLEIAGKLNATNAAANKILAKAQFDNAGISESFDRGKVGIGDALTSSAAVKAQAIADLTVKLDALKAIIDKVSADGGIVDPEQVKTAAALGRQIEGIKQNFGEIDLIERNHQRGNDIFDAAKTKLDNERNAGTISSKQADDQLDALQQKRIADLQVELTQLQKLDQTLPDVAAKVAAVTNELGTLHNEVNNEFIATAQSINGTIGDAFSTFLDNIQSGTQSIGDSFRQLVAGLLLGIAKAIAQALLLKFILKPLGLTSGDSGGVGGFFSGLIGGGSSTPDGHADGGIISGAGTGVSDSIPAMLSHGEGIIPASRVNAYGRSFINSIIRGTFIPGARFTRFAVGGFAGGDSGSAGGRGVRIINTVDPNLVKEFMQSSAGEEIILNVLGKNPGLVQRLV